MSAQELILIVLAAIVLVLASAVVFRELLHADPPEGRVVSRGRP